MTNVQTEALEVIESEAKKESEAKFVILYFDTQKRMTNMEKLCCK